MSKISSAGSSFMRGISLTLILLFAAGSSGAQDKIVSGCVIEYKRTADGGVTTPLSFSLYPKEFDCLADAARKGSEEAVLRISEYYTMSRNDRKEDLKWLRIGATNNNRKVQVRLGNFLVDRAKDHFPDGNTNDLIEEGLMWLRKAADSGDAIAMYWLSEYYEKTPATRAEARAWRLKSAEAGNVWAAEKQMKETIDGKSRLAEVLISMETFNRAKIMWLQSLIDFNKQWCFLCEETADGKRCESDLLSYQLQERHYTKFQIAVGMMKNKSTYVDGLKALDEMVAIPKIIPEVKKLSDYLKNNQELKN